MGPFNFSATCNQGVNIQKQRLELRTANSSTLTPTNSYPKRTKEDDEYAEDEEEEEEEEEEPTRDQMDEEIGEENDLGASKGATPKPSPAKEATPPPSEPPSGAPSAIAGAAPSGAKGGAAPAAGGALGVAAQIEQAVAVERERWEKIMAASNDAGDATSQQVALSTAPDFWGVRPSPHANPSNLFRAWSTFVQLL